MKFFCLVAVAALAGSAAIDTLRARRSRVTDVSEPDLPPAPKDLPADIKAAITEAQALTKKGKSLGTGSTAYEGRLAHSHEGYAAVEATREIVRAHRTFLADTKQWMDTVLLVKTLDAADRARTKREREYKDFNLNFNVLLGTADPALLKNANALDDALTAQLATPLFTHADHYEDGFDYFDVAYELVPSVWGAPIKAAPKADGKKATPVGFLLRTFIAGLETAAEAGAKRIESFKTSIKLSTDNSKDTKSKYKADEKAAFAKEAAATTAMLEKAEEQAAVIGQLRAHFKSFAHGAIAKSDADAQTFLDGLNGWLVWASARKGFFTKDGDATDPLLTLSKYGHALTPYADHWHTADSTGIAAGAALLEKYKAAAKGKGLLL